MSNSLRCGALTQAGTRCLSRAIEENDWWRCVRHTHWYDTATPAERFHLAELEIEELMQHV